MIDTIEPAMITVKSNSVGLRQPLVKAQINA
jgi:hypothetical protein